MARGRQDPAQAMGLEMQTPMIPIAGITKKAAMKRITSSPMPAIVGTRLFPRPYRVLRKMKRRPSTQYMVPCTLR